MSRFIILYALTLVFCLPLSAQNQPSGCRRIFYQKRSMTWRLLKGNATNGSTTFAMKSVVGWPDRRRQPQRWNYTFQMLDSMSLDSVWLQPCTVPHWVRGPKETLRIVNSQKRGSIDLKCLALGKQRWHPAQPELLLR